MVPRMNPKMIEIANLVRKYEGVAVINYGLAKQNRVDVDVSGGSAEEKEKLKSLIKAVEKYKDTEVDTQTQDKDKRMLKSIEAHVSICSVEYAGKDLVIGLDCSDEECMEIWPYIFRKLNWPRSVN